MARMQFVTWTGLRPWLIGVLLCAAGMFLGYELGGEIATLLGGEPGLFARAGKGFVWGGVIGALQWLVVRTAGVSPARFLMASAVCFAVGYPLGQTAQAIIVRQWSMHGIGYGSALATFGLCLGLPQWWVLRRGMQRASLWILLSVTGWVLTGMTWTSSGAGSGVDAVVYGTVTGLGLAWLVRSQRSNVAIDGS